MSSVIILINRPTKSQSQSQSQSQIEGTTQQCSIIDLSSSSILVPTSQESIENESIISLPSQSLVSSSKRSYYSAVGTPLQSPIAPKRRKSPSNTSTGLKQR